MFRVYCCLAGVFVGLFLFCVFCGNMNEKLAVRTMRYAEVMTKQYCLHSLISVPIEISLFIAFIRNWKILSGPEGPETKITCIVLYCIYLYSKTVYNENPR